MAGFTAGATSVILTMPFDVVKTRMQVQSHLHSQSLLVFPCVRSLWTPSQAIDAAKYKGTLDCCRSILAKEGLSCYRTSVACLLGL